MNNQYATFRHKNGTILATIEEKCVTLSDLKGNIYKQFPRQHFRPEDFTEQVSFPVDYSQARLEFNQQNARKNAEAELKREALRLARIEQERKEYEERKRQVLLVRSLRNQVFDSGESTAYAFYSEEYDIGNDCYHNFEVSIYQDKESALADYNKKRESAIKDVDYGWEVHLYVIELTYSTDEIEDITSYESLQENAKDRYESSYCEVIPYQGYEDLAGGIILTWCWEPYVGYAREFRYIERESSYSDRTTEDLITGNDNRTFRPNLSLILTGEQIEGLEGEDLKDAIIEAVYDFDHRWSNPAALENAINELCGLEDY